MQQASLTVVGEERGGLGRVFSQPGTDRGRGIVGTLLQRMSAVVAGIRVPWRQGLYVVGRAAVATNAPAGKAGHQLFVIDCEVEHRVQRLAALGKEVLQD